MDLMTSFEPTRFGSWIVKLSYIRDESSFVAVMFHLYNFEVMVKAFKDEIEVVNFVTNLGEKYE
jgi:hypothetical protein